MPSREGRRNGYDVGLLVTPIPRLRRVRTRSVEQRRGGDDVLAILNQATGSTDTVMFELEPI